jgi:hypothetical protein
MGERTLKIVVGYVRGVDRLPRHVQDLHLTRRVAFVLDSYRSDNVDMFFDAELYAALLDSTREVFGADRMSAVLSRGETATIGSASDAERILQSELEGGSEPFTKVMLSRGGTIVAVIESEPFAYSGGPEPYHDSFTVPIYSREDAAGRLEASARSVCSRLGAEITEIVRASESPEAPGLIARIKGRIGLGD